MDSQELLLNFMAADGISGVLRDIGSAIEAMAQKSIEALKGISGFAGVAGEAIGKVAEGIGLAAGVAGGLFAAADHLATKTGEYSLAILENSAKLGLNTDQMQTWVQGAKLLGVEQDRLDAMMLRFEKNLFQGGVALERAGINLKDLGVTSRDAGEALNQLADYFHKTDDSVQKAFITFGLFGKGAAAIEPLLNMGRDGLKALEDELRNLGLVLDPATLQVDALGRVMQERFHVVLQGIEMSLGSRLIPAFMMLWDVLGKIAEGVTHTGSVMNAFTDIVAKGVIWLTAFIAALTGTKISAQDFAKALDDPITQLVEAGGAAKGTSDAIDDTGAKLKKSQEAMKALTDQIRDVTQAFQDQIGALQAQQKAFDEASQAQVDSLSAEKAAYDDLIDAQRASYQEELRKLDLAFRQQQQHQVLSDLQKKIAKDQNDIAAAMFLNIPNTGGLFVTLEADQDAAQKQMSQMALDANKLQLEDKIRSLENEKKARDQSFQDHIKQIEAVRKAHDEELADRIKNVEAERTTVLRGLQDQMEKLQAAQAAGQAAYGAIGDSAAQSTAYGKQVHADLEAALKANFSGASAAGTGAFNAIRDAIVGVQVATIDAKWILIGFVDTIRFMVDWVQVAVYGLGAMAEFLNRNIGAALEDVGKMVKALGRVGDFFGTDYGARAQAEIDALTRPTVPTSGASPRPYAEGGVVSGPMGAPQLAIVHGGEEVSTPSQQDRQAGLLAEIRDLLDRIANDTPAPGGWSASLRAG
jgi:hypothetical protein